MSGLDYLQDADWKDPDGAECWDELPLWSAPFGLRLLDCVPLKPGLVILDLFAGTGFLTLELAERCGPGSRVIAVDIWREVLDRLRRKARYAGLRNVEILERDAADTGLPDASVDLIVSNLGINNVENRDAVLRACFRVARPGAPVLMTTNLVGHMTEFYDVFRATLAETGHADRFRALEEHINHRLTVPLLARELQAAGFEMQNEITDSFRMRFADGTSLLRHHFVRRGFMRNWKLVVPAEALERVFGALERNLNALAAWRGELSLTVPMACLTARKPPA